MVSVLYIDDEVHQQGRDARKIQKLLHIPGNFECELSMPPQSFAQLPADLPDALLVDFDLSTVPPNGEPVSYFGSTLASEVRMRHPVCPIVLVTRPQVLWQSQLLEESIDVDLIVYKDDINRNPDDERSKIVALIDGFQDLSRIDGRDWSDVLHLITTEEGVSASLCKRSVP